MKLIIYYLKDHKKINGTLFYCFEYMLCASELAQDVKFCIFNCKQQDHELILKIFREKYNYPKEIESNIFYLNTIKELYDLNASKVMILDIHTFEKTSYFLKSEILCFSNHDHKMVRSDIKKITYYGNYDYQPKDIKCDLKIGFKYFKSVPEFTEIEDVAFVSDILFKFDYSVLPSQIRNIKTIKKNQNSHYDDLFSKFNVFVYIHNSLDTNNRMLLECDFFKKKIFYIPNEQDIPDSAYYRYIDIVNKDTAKYHLTTDDILIKDFTKNDEKNIAT